MTLRLAGLVALIVGVAIVGYATGLTALTADELREWLRASSRLAPLVFIFLFFALNTLGLPAPVLGALGGVTFGVRRWDRPMRPSPHISLHPNRGNTRWPCH